MYLDPDKAEERLSSTSNIANKLRDIRSSHRLEVDANVAIHRPGLRYQLPKVVREEAKELVANGASNKEVAETFGITEGRVSKIRQEVNGEKTLDIATQAKDAALNKMMLAMGLISEEKLSQMQPGGLANVAAQMAKVAECMSPKSQMPLVNLVVYAPEVKDESKYKVVEIANNK